jgi:hypothetical protein
MIVRLGYSNIHMGHPPQPRRQGMLTHVAKPTSEASTDVLSESDEENSKLQAWQASCGRIILDISKIYLIHG